MQHVLLLFSPVPTGAAQVSFGDWEALTLLHGG